MPCGAPRVTPIEIAGALTGLWCVALLWRGSVWNWPVGLINNALFFVLFWGAGLYADASLQVVFFLFGVWGWWNWLRGTTTPDAAPTRAPTAHLIALIPASLIGTAALSLILQRFSDSTVPTWDGAVTALSLGAVWMQGRKYLENWLVWIAVDVLSIGLYLYKDLALTAALYAVFLGLCVVGYRDWRRITRRIIAPAPGAA